MYLNTATVCAAKISYFRVLSRIRGIDVGWTVVCLRILSYNFNKIFIFNQVFSACAHTSETCEKLLKPV